MESIMPIIERYSTEKDAKSFRESTLVKAQKVFSDKVEAVFRKKLGFHPDDESGDKVWDMLEPMMRETKTDWTVFWRRLSTVATEYPISTTDANDDVNYEEMLELLHGNDEVTEGSSPFYEPLSDGARTKYLKWIQLWRESLNASHKQNKNGNYDNNDNETYFERMRQANPKYTLREWMLVDAYTKASFSSLSNPMFQISLKSTETTDESMIHELFELIQNPYEEGTQEQEEKYYRRAPDKALKQGGTAFMS
uniref:Selenoprotein O n=1 Tax=Eucampia antarctica TaxID=49252 RepID=A0A7S2S736_9STRA